MHRGGTGRWVGLLAGLLLGGLPGMAFAQDNQQNAREARRTAELTDEEESSASLGDRDGAPALERTPYDEEGGQPPPARRNCGTATDNPDAASQSGAAEETGEATSPAAERRCRRVVVKISGRGGPVAFADAPWQVSMWSFKYTDYTAEEYRRKPEWLRRHKCGGTLIASEWVLTAAHCVSGDLADHPFRVRIGYSNLTDPRGKLFRVKRTYKHPDYNPVDKQNDVALLWIEPVNLPGVRPVRLKGVSGSARIQPETPAYVLGFGKTRTAAASALLLWAPIRVWPREACKTAMRELAARITASVTCALGDDGADSCQGDSGGPLMDGKGAAALQIGVVSWGRGCAQPGSPGVYANVPRYLNWIWKTTGGRAGRSSPPQEF